MLVHTGMGWASNTVVPEEQVPPASVTDLEAGVVSNVTTTLVQPDCLEEDGSDTKTKPQRAPERDVDQDAAGIYEVLHQRGVLLPEGSLPPQGAMPDFAVRLERELQNYAAHARWAEAVARGCLRAA